MRVNTFNIQSLFNPVFNLQQKKYSEELHLKESNLITLSKDTVDFSFKGGKLEGANMKFAPSMSKCEEVYEDTENAADYLQKKLHRYLDEINKGTKPGKELITIKVRRKEPLSIQEKVVSKYSKNARQETDKFYEETIKQIFQYFKPKKKFTEEKAIVRARVKMNELMNNGKVPPYSNEAFFLNTIVKELEENKKLITYNSDMPKKEAMREILSHLQSITKNDHCDDKGSYIDTQTIEGIRHYVNDAVGARIVLNDSSKNTVLKVIGALKKASANGDLNITSIENIVPELSKKDLAYYEYTSETPIKSLAERTNSQYKQKKSTSGYMAIHINLDLTHDELINAKGKNKKERNKFNGFQGEIQIIDANIESLKDIEDLCYKLKDNKNPPLKKYVIFKKYFNLFYKTPKIKEAFDNYTFDLYLNQRKKSLDNNKKSKTFATIEELGYKKLLPEALDFNNLKEIKEVCDRHSADEPVKMPSMQELNQFYMKKNNNFKKIIKSLDVQV